MTTQMHSQLSPYNIADYCAAMGRGEVIVNRDYQRSPEVWPNAARSFLIETILLGFPMPKLSLHQITDVKTRKSIKEIVDGQQRSMAISDYFNDKFALSGRAEPEDAAGCRYSQLSEELQGKFLSYPLSVDLFVGATSEDIREVFRRMNSYTVPLNAEERRHARFQGELKWFISDLAKRYSEALRRAGTFTDRQLIRMADAKLYAELIYTLLKGIGTTKDVELTELYSSHDRKFKKASEVKRHIAGAMDFVLDAGLIHRTAVMRPYQLFTMLLAIAHAKGDLTKLRRDYKFRDPGRKLASRDSAIRNLSHLAAVIEDQSPPKPYRRFVEAGASKTNVEQHRKIRFQFYCRALADDLP